jgi:hypothetical protein
MNRILYIAAVLPLMLMTLLFVAGCGDGDQADPQPKQEPSVRDPSKPLPPSPVKIALVTQPGSGRKLSIGIRASKFPKEFRNGRGARVTVRVLDEQGVVVESKTGKLTDFGFS